MRRNLHALSAAATLAATTLLGACAASGTPELDSRFGAATRTLAAQQTYDAAAPQRNGSRVPATDGRTMREAADRQVESFKAPPVTNVINIGVGGGG